MITRPDIEAIEAHWTSGSTSVNFAAYVPALLLYIRELEARLALLGGGK